MAQLISRSYRRKVAVLIPQPHQSFHNVIESHWLFLEEYEIEPSGKDEVTIAKGIAITGILSKFVEYASAEAISIYSETVGGSMEVWPASSHFENRVRDVFNPQYFNLVVAVPTNLLQIHLHQLVEDTRLPLAHSQDKRLYLIFSEIICLFTHSLFLLLGRRVEGRFLL